MWPEMTDPSPSCWVVCVLKVLNENQLRVDIGRTPLEGNTARLWPEGQIKL